jgi:hypothetical protein
MLPSGKKTRATVVAANGSSTAITYDATGHATQKQSFDGKGATIPRPMMPPAP